MSGTNSMLHFAPSPAGCDSDTFFYSRTGEGGMKEKKNSTGGKGGKRTHFINTFLYPLKKGRKEKRKRREGDKKKKEKKRQTVRLPLHLLREKKKETVRRLREEKKESSRIGNTSSTEERGRKRGRGKGKNRGTDKSGGLLSFDISCGRAGKKREKEKKGSHLS